ncbi:MAG TPA: ROK family protein [Sphingobium sp.]|nr:ROK family protein [Sphingobium sp.]
MTLVAGVELGGTKCICILGTGPQDVRACVEIATTSPAETLDAVARVLAGWRFDALGLASFGPLALDPGSPRFGSIVSTPKPGWSDVDIVHLAQGRPFALDTDVNAAALAEGRWGAAQGLTSWAYITVGTGIGVGSIVAGDPLRGLGHSEAGHMRLPRDPADDFPGICPFHGDCLEGMANGPAIAARAGRKGQEIAADDPLWGFVAGQLAALCHNLLLTTLPQRILIGGGVAIGQAQLLPMLRQRLRASLGGYGITQGLDLDDVVRLPALGSHAGPMGALALAHRAIRSAN